MTLTATILPNHTETAVQYGPLTLGPHDITILAWPSGTRHTEEVFVHPSDQKANDNYVFFRFHEVPEKVMCIVDGVHHPWQPVT